MGLQVEKNIPNGVSVTDARYRITREDGTLMKSGLVDIDVGSTPNVAISLTGVLASLGERVELIVDDDDGTGVSPVHASISRVFITDDGVAAASLYTIQVVGDSFVDNCSSDTTDGGRPSNQSVTLSQGFWVDASMVSCESDYIFRPDMGQSGTKTGNILARIDSIIADDPNLYMLCVGTNDSSNNDIETTKSNYTAIVTAMLSSGNSKVLLIPCTHRNDEADPSAKNAFVDELNAHLISMAASTYGVEISPVNTEFDTLIKSDQVTYGGVSDDGLHPNFTLGSAVLGRTIATTLDTLFPSTLPFTPNIVPPFSTDETGSMTSGATGATPNGWRGYYAKNNTEYGFSRIERGDGKIWWQVRTNGEESPPSSSNKSKIQSWENEEQATTEGWWVAEMLVEVPTQEDLDVMSYVSIAGDSSGGTYYNCKTYVKALEVGVPRRIRSPSIRCENDKGYMMMETSQVPGKDFVLYFTEPKFYKVEDL